MLKDFQRQGGIAFLWDQLGWIVRRQPIDKEKIGGGNGLFQQLDPLADERGDGQKLFRRCCQSSLLKKWLKELGKLIDGQRAMCSR